MGSAWYLVVTYAGEDEAFASITASMKELLDA
jgi:hypothetical protein